jgi:hypothetical protein
MTHPKSADRHSLNREQIETLVQIVREESGDQVTRPRFDDAILVLFEDIAGFDSLPASRRRKYMNLLWLRYQIAAGRK